MAEVKLELQTVVVALDTLLGSIRTAAAGKLFRFTAEARKAAMDELEAVIQACKVVVTVEETE